MMSLVVDCALVKSLVIVSRDLGSNPISLGFGSVRGIGGGLLPYIAFLWAFLS